MGKRYSQFLAASKVFCCCECKTHLAVIDQLISKQFNGQHGKACLFESVFNIIEGPAEDRTMTTGLHTVRDIRCSKCDMVLGWKYERAYEASQRYKEGRFILEKNLLIEAEDITLNVEALDSPLQIIVGPDKSRSSSVMSAD